MEAIQFALGMFLLAVVTLQRAAAVKCFVCDNGDAVSPNFSCPAEGKVSFQATKLQECDGKCYIRTRHGHGKGGAVVQRGCLPTSWLRTFIQDGCDVMNSDIWCFCDTEGCNGKRLGEWFPMK
ncbi:uncharacterized protein LOC121382761 [Gigantopelta aegis]|uniref:uncharacterized protein LOC121382761 n=1 Tax=Gigantopelta aegis TaxID=1735272 RepID=UPI001B88E16C|nr:uncharacterized protein LOC121382761 [Gigantopelta aegis]